MLMADVPGKPIANWLRVARQSQRMPNGRPWTYDFLFERMRETIQWAPAHPNYSKYENGKATPNPDTLEKLSRFWARLGVAPPDLTPPKPPEPTPDPLVAALTAQTLAISQLIERLDSLASQAIRDGVLDALREAGLGQDAGASPPAPPPAPQP